MHSHQAGAKWFPSRSPSWSSVGGFDGNVWEEFVRGSLALDKMSQEEHSFRGTIVMLRPSNGSIPPGGSKMSKSKGLGTSHGIPENRRFNVQDVDTLGDSWTMPQIQEKHSPPSDERPIDRPSMCSRKRGNRKKIKVKLANSNKFHKADRQPHLSPSFMMGESEELSLRSNASSLSFGASQGKAAGRYAPQLDNCSTGMPGHGNSKYQSLTQKYDPVSLEEIVGQSLVLQALSNALSRGRIAPLYVFYGPHGTGKTCCARLFARALHCIVLGKGQPCGSCIECAAYNVQKYLMSKEFSSEGYHGLGPTRSSLSSYKAYILDDCHELSTQAWNAFLKVVNESPEKTVFILTTSSIECVPLAITSRCQKFFFSKIQESDIINKLHSIVWEENLEVDSEALNLIASASDGSLCEAEIILDQLSLLGQKITLPMVQEMMGLIPDGDLILLLDSALSADITNALQRLKEIMASGVEPLNLMSQFAYLLSRMLSGGYQVSEQMQEKTSISAMREEVMSRLRQALQQALRVLTDWHRHQRGSFDHITWFTSILLQLAPDSSLLAAMRSSSRQRKSTSKTLKDHRRKGRRTVKQENNNLKLENGHEYLANETVIEEVWLRVLGAVDDTSLRDFLRSQGELISLTLSRGFVAASLEFRMEDLSKAEASSKVVAEAFQAIFGYPVEIEVHLASQQLPLISENGANSFHKMHLLSDVKQPECVEPKTSNKLVLLEPSRYHSLSTTTKASPCKDNVENSVSTTTEDFTCKDNIENAWLQIWPNSDNWMSTLMAMKHDVGEAEKQLSLGFVLQQADGSVDGYSQDLQFDFTNRLPADKFMRLESRLIRGNEMRNSRVKSYRRPELLLSFCSCSEVL